MNYNLSTSSAHQGDRVAAEGGFKHIKVTPADQQEVVIHAGAPRSSAPASETETVGASQDERTASRSAGKPGRSPKPGAFQPTTLEDIQSSKMPKTQVVIIVVAVLAIIAFAVWYAFFS